MTLHAASPLLPLAVATPVVAALVPQSEASANKKLALAMEMTKAKVLGPHGAAGRLGAFRLHSPNAFLHEARSKVFELLSKKLSVRKGQYGPWKEGLARHARRASLIREVNWR